jgi:hypothetical protein
MKRRTQFLLAMVIGLTLSCVIHGLLMKFPVVEIFTRVAFLTLGGIIGWFTRDAVELPMRQDEEAA